MFSTIQFCYNFTIIYMFVIIFTFIAEMYQTLITAEVCARTLYNTRYAYVYLYILFQNTIGIYYTNNRH